MNLPHSVEAYWKGFAKKEKAITGLSSESVSNDPSHIKIVPFLRGNLMAELKPRFLLASIWTLVLEKDARVFEFLPEECRLRAYDLDNKVSTLGPISRDLYEKTVSCIEKMARMNTQDCAMEQTGRMPINLDGTLYEVDISTVSTESGKYLKMETYLVAVKHSEERSDEERSDRECDSWTFYRAAYQDSELWKARTEALKQAKEFICHDCGVYDANNKIEIHHEFYPINMFSGDSPDNLVVLCSRHHEERHYQGKGAKKVFVESSYRYDILKPVLPEWWPRPSREDLDSERWLIKEIRGESIDGG